MEDTPKYVGAGRGKESLYVLLVAPAFHLSSHLSSHERSHE